MVNLGQAQWEALKWVLRYIDVDYKQNVDTRKSLSMYVFTLLGTIICWKESLQLVIALSITQVKYITFAEGVKEIALEDNQTNIFTKSLPISKFKHCLDLINFFEAKLLILANKKSSLILQVKLESRSIPTETETECISTNRRRLGKLKSRSSPSCPGQDDFLSWLTLFQFFDSAWRFCMPDPTC
ncbi:hypothetical protein CR513_11073, partial [Mucuna pruriens]